MNSITNNKTGISYPVKDAAKVVNAFPGRFSVSKPTPAPPELAKAGIDKAAAKVDSVKVEATEREETEKQTPAGKDIKTTETKKTK